MQYIIISSCEVRKVRCSGFGVSLSKKHRIRPRQHCSSFDKLRDASKSLFFRAPPANAYCIGSASLPGRIGQTIDLLLYDMGEDRADGCGDFRARGAQWRPQPLLGRDRAAQITRRANSSVKDARAMQSGVGTIARRAAPAKYSTQSKRINAPLSSLA